MKITCDREKLLAAFQTAATISPTKSPKPVLQSVKLRVTEDSAVIAATDMEVGIRLEVAGIETTTPGEVLLPVARFGPILRECSDEKLTIESSSQGTSVVGEHSEFSLQSENPAEFPDIVQFEEERYHEVPARLLKELIRRTLFATDTESNRYALGGIKLELDDKSVTGIGTDGRRLAKMEGPAQAVGGHETGETTAIAPSRSMQLIERALSDGDAEVQVCVRPNDLLVKTPRATIYARLVEGRFPAWRDVFPEKRGSIRLDMAVGPMHSALRQAAVVASDSSRGIDFTFGEGSLVLKASTADVGNSRIELPIPYDGEAVTITLDHRYVSDFLRVLDPDRTFQLELENSDSAVVFSTDDGYGYVVMPLARNQE